MREEAVEAHAMRVLLAAAARWLGRRRAAAMLFQRAWAARDERRERRAERERARVNAAGSRGLRQTWVKGPPARSLREFVQPIRFCAVRSLVRSFVRSFFRSFPRAFVR